MATGTYAGTNATIVDAIEAKTSGIGEFVDGNQVSGIVRCSIDRCVAATATGLTLGGTMKVGQLPKGAVVLYSIVSPIATATFDAPDGTTGATTGTLGIAGDADLFGDVTTLATALGQIVTPKPDGTTYDNALHPLEADVEVIFTSAGADWTDTEGLLVKIFYVMA